MTCKDWITQTLDKTLPNGFDWDYVVADEDEIESIDGEPKENFLYVVAKANDDNEIYLFSFINILDAKDFIRGEISDGDCMANGGRGGPDLESEWVILDLVERKVINVERKVLVEYREE